MSRHLDAVRLLPPELLHRTGPVDHADWNYRPLLGWVQRMRFRLVLSLLPGVPVQRLLEIGYGSGVFLPELARHCQHLDGVDVHACNREVSEALVKVGVTARLMSSSATDIPVESGLFDCVVAVSALEFVDDIDAACVEIRRVLKPSGVLVVVTPAQSRLLDAGLRLLTGERAKHDYSGRRRFVIPALTAHFAIHAQLSAPAFLPSFVRPYVALRLGPRPG